MTNLADPQFLYIDLFLITPVAVLSKIIYRFFFELKVFNLSFKIALKIK
jgi:hypothetical protein